MHDCKKLSSEHVSLDLLPWILPASLTASYLIVSGTSKIDCLFDFFSNNVLSDKL